MPVTLNIFVAVMRNNVILKIIGYGVGITFKIKAEFLLKMNQEVVRSSDFDFVLLLIFISFFDFLYFRFNAVLASANSI